MCKEAVTNVLCLPRDKVALQFILLRSRWHNCQKLASSNGLTTSWKDCLRLEKKLSPTSSVSQLLDDCSSTKQVVEGFNTPQQSHSLHLEPPLPIRCPSEAIERVMEQDSDDNLADDVNFSYSCQVFCP